MITVKKYLPRDAWNDKKRLTKITLDAAARNFNVNYRKESGLYKGFKVLDLKTTKIVIDVRFYNTTGRANYCAMWIYSVMFKSSGTGRACGYGYNRESAAFNEAIDNCGISNFPCFSGSGCNTWAIDILCKILGVKKYKIIEFYG
jgi:hypothetical protein